jgi:hypothetical protein
MAFEATSRLLPNFEVIREDLTVVATANCIATVLRTDRHGIHATPMVGSDLNQFFTILTAPYSEQAVQSS